MVIHNRSIKIFLTDDDVDDRNIFCDAFRELKLSNDLTLFDDGVELMTYLKSGLSELPQLVLIDLNMPRKSGFECLREIRSDERLKKISVAIYSTSSSENDIAETFSCGANLYIKKPSEYSKLKTIIKQIMETNWQYTTARRTREKYLLKI